MDTVVSSLPGDSLQDREPVRKRHLPLGVKDHFWQGAWIRHDLEARILASFHAWGYNDVIPPMFEYADTLDVQVSADSNMQLYRFLDRDGRTLVLRPDMTTSVARLVGTRLAAEPGPFRFCYAGSVFRHEASSGLEYQQEFRQLGIELIGAGTPAADAEILASLSSALHACHLHQFRMVLGHSGYYHGLRRELCLAPHLERDLRNAMQRKSESALQTVMAQGQISPRQSQSLETLLGLYGTEPERVLDQAATSCLNRHMEQALADLQSICAHLAAYDELNHVLIDLSEIRDLDYYTGMTFEILLPDSSVVAGSGGRYDNLVGHFGPPRPSVGGAVQLEQLVRAVNTGQMPRALKPAAPTLLIGCTRDAVCLRFAKRMRREGIDIVIDPVPRPAADLRAYGKELEARMTVEWDSARAVFRCLHAIMPHCDGNRDLDCQQMEAVLRQPRDEQPHVSMPVRS